MKKLLALLLALVMVFALAACGGTEGTPSDAPASDAPASDAPASEAPADSGDGTVANKDSPWSGSTASPPTAPPASSTWPL